MLAEALEGHSRGAEFSCQPNERSQTETQGLWLGLAYGERMESPLNQE